MRRTVKGTIQRILAHGCVICGMVIVTFQILDWYNPLYGFPGTCRRRAESALFLLGGLWLSVYF